MTLRIDCEAVPAGGPFSEFSPEETLYAVAEAFAAETDCPYEFAADVLFCGEEEIRSLNASLRGVDGVTDVLSFPASDFPEPGDFAFLEGEEDAFDPDTGELILGDIALCCGRILRQAAEFGHSVKRETAYLTAHSLLHLIGYDHTDPEGEAEMTYLAERIMTRCGIGKETVEGDG